MGRPAIVAQLRLASLPLMVAKVVPQRQRRTEFAGLHIHSPLNRRNASAQVLVHGYSNIIASMNPNCLPASSSDKCHPAEHEASQFPRPPLPARPRMAESVRSADSGGRAAMRANETAV